MSALWSSAEALHIKRSQKPPLLIKPHGVADFEYSRIESFFYDFKTKFLDIKSLLRDHMGAKVSLAKFQSRSNLK